MRRALPALLFLAACHCGASTPTPAGSGSSAGPGASSGSVAFGGGALAGCPIFPADNPWNTDVSGYPVHERSEAYIAAVGKDGHLHPDFGTVWEGAPIGIPYVVVPGTQPKVPILFTDYPEESDPGPYPIPPDAPIEGGPDADGDRHILVVDKDHCLLYEVFYAWPDGKRWKCSSGAVWDLRINDKHPESWTSADAAGLPILPGLVRYDEVVEQKAIRHALRFTAQKTQRGYIAPASHFASKSSDPDLPPMGLRVRMKASYDCSALSAEAQVVCAALKTYGMLLADNGSSWFISGAPDSRWNDEALNDLKRIPGSAFEALDTGSIEGAF